MKPLTLALVSLSITALAACDSAAEQQADQVEDRVEMQAEQSAASSGSQIVALGMTEAQLIDADLVTSTGTDLGDVEAVQRGAAGAVEGLLVSLDDINPDRYVVVPMDGLMARPEGDDMDVQTAMTAADLAALPDSPLGAPTTPAAM